MTTVISVSTSDGTRRCDATCHNATGDMCRCVCGGRLHGIGADHALERNTRDLLGDELVEQLRAAGELRFPLEADVQLAIEVPA